MSSPEENLPINHIELTDEALATLEQWPEKQRLRQSLGRNLHMKCLCLTILVVICILLSTWCGLYSMILYKPHFFPDFDMMNQTEYPCHKYLAIPIVIGTTFDYSHCGMQDVSKLIKGMDHYGAVKVRISKGFAFANRKAAQEFEVQRSSFFQLHEARDEFMEMREGLDLLESEFVDYVLTYKNKSGPPWYIYSALYWVASVLLLSWPLRVLIEYQTAFLDFSVIKLFGVNYFIPGEISPRTSVACVGTTERNNNDVDDVNDVHGTCAAVRRLSQLHLAHLALSSARLRKAAHPSTISETIDEVDDAAKETTKTEAKSVSRQNSSVFLLQTPQQEQPPQEEELMKQQYHFSHSYGGGGDTKRDQPKMMPMDDGSMGESGGSLKRRIERPVLATANRLGLSTRWSDAESVGGGGGNVHHNEQHPMQASAGASEHNNNNNNNSQSQWRHGIVARGTLIRRGGPPPGAAKVENSGGTSDMMMTTSQSAAEEDDENQKSGSKKKKKKKSKKHHHHHKDKDKEKPPPLSFKEALASSKPVVLPRLQTERLLRSPTPKDPQQQSNSNNLLPGPATTTALYSMAMNSAEALSGRLPPAPPHTLVVPVHQEYMQQQQQSESSITTSLLLTVPHGIGEVQRRRSSALDAEEFLQMPRRKSRQHETTI